MRHARLAAVLVLLVGFLHVAVLQSGDVLIDDAFIFFRYVDNLLAGHGLTWNPGGERVEGYTSFLWVALLLLPRALGAEPVVLVHLLNLALFAGLLLSVLGLVRREAGGWRPALVLAPLFVATSSILGEAARSGMELVLFLFLVVAALHLHLAANPRARARFLGGLVFGLLVLARPEGLLVYLACAGVALWEGRGAARAALVRELPRLLGLGVLLLPHLAWRIGYYGELFPNTFHAKVSFSLANVGRGLAGLAQFLGTFRGALLAASLVLWSLVPRTRLGAHLALLLAVWLGYCAIYLGLPDWRENYNYTVLVDLGAALLLGWSLLPLVEGRGAGARLVPGLAVALLVAGNLQGALATHAQSGTGWRLTLRDEPRQGMTAGFVAIGRKLRELAAPGASVATGACGAIPYYSGLVTYDTLGLNDKHIARQPIRDPGKAPFGHERGDGAYVLAQKPTYVIMLPFPTQAPTRGFTGFARTFRDLAESAEFKREYEFKSVPLADGQYFNYFTRK